MSIVSVKLNCQYFGQNDKTSSLNLKSRLNNIKLKIMHIEMWEISFLVFIVTLSLAHAILYLKKSFFINIAFNYDGKDP